MTESKTGQALLRLVYTSLQDGLVTPQEVLHVCDSFMAETGAEAAPGGGAMPFMQPGPGGNPFNRPKRRKLNPGAAAPPTGFPHPPRGMTRYIGTLQNYSPKNGYGFLKCPETKEKYKQDVFLHKTQYNELQLQCGGFVNLGAWVEFSVEEKEGKPQARKVMLYQNPHGMGGMPMGGMGYM